MNVLVLGGYGAVGGHVVRLLRAAIDRELAAPTWMHEILGLNDLRDTLHDNEITLEQRTS